MDSILGKNLALLFLFVQSMQILARTKTPPSLAFPILFVILGLMLLVNVDLSIFRRLLNFIRLRFRRAMEARSLKTRVGDIFSAGIDGGTIRYFQLIARDSTQLNSDVIRVFKGTFSSGQKIHPKLLAVFGVDFYAHTTLDLGIVVGFFQKVGFSSEVGETSNILFRGSNQLYGQKKEDKWWVWKINHIPEYIGTMNEENYEIEQGLIFPPSEIVYRMKWGKYRGLYFNADGSIRVHSPFDFPEDWCRILTRASHDYRGLALGERIWLHVQLLIQCTIDQGLIAYFVETDTTEIKETIENIKQLGMPDIIQTMLRMQNLFPSGKLSSEVEVRAKIVESWDDETLELAKQIHDQFLEQLSELETALVRFISANNLLYSSIRQSIEFAEQPQIS